MADAEHNNKQTKEKYTETIAYDKHHDQPKPITNLFLSNLVSVTRRRFSLFGGSRTKLDSRKTHTSHHRTYISMAPQHRKFLKIEIHAYLFRFLFSIPPYFRLNPPWAQLLHFGLSCLASIRSAFFLAAFGTLHGEGGAGSMAEMEKRDCGKDVHGKKMWLGKCSV